MKILSKIKNNILIKRIKTIGSNVKIENDIIIDYPENLTIGNNVKIGIKSRLNAQGEIHIGNNVIFGPNVFLWTANHDYFSPDLLPYGTVVINAPIRIYDNVWIGANVSIVPGITIEEGAVICMGAVVTKDVKKCTVVGGNPAKFIKYRDIEVYEKLKKENKYNFRW